MMYLHKISETVKTTTKIESLLDMRDTCTCKKKYKWVRFNTFTSYLVHRWKTLTDSQSENDAD